MRNEGTRCRLLIIPKPMSSQIFLVNPGLEDGGSFTCKARIGDEEQTDSAVISFIRESPRPGFAQRLSECTE